MGKFLTDVDLNQNELQYAVIQNLNADPIVSTTGQIYYNTNISKLRLKTSAAWVTITSGTTTIPTLQDVVNTGNGISNFGGVGNASIQSTNFTNNRTLYLNDNAYPTIRLVDNLNASNNLQIDLDTLTLDGVSYNWSTIVNPPASPLSALPFTTDHLAATNNQYVVGDLVWYLGDVYRCLANNDSIIPTSTLYWTNLGAGYPLVQQPVDWNSTSGNNQILNKPTIPTTPSLQQVTTVGAITSDAITVAGIYSGNFYSDGYTFGLSDNYDGNYNFLYTPYAGLQITDTINSVYLYQDASIGFQTAAGFGNLRSDLVTGSQGWQLPNASGTLALTSNIPTVGTWGALNYPTWTAGTPFVKMTAAGIFALDTTTYYPYPTGTISQYIRGDGTLATFPSITIPTLQQVLDNNHDLNLGRNYQGTSAGSSAIGNDNNGFGSAALINSSANGVNALGNSAGNGSSGSYLNFMGLEAGKNNSGSNVNIFGSGSTTANIYSSVNILGSYGSADADNQTVFSKLIVGNLAYLARLSYANITANRKYELPNNSGTIALTSDIPTYTIPTLQQVTTAGNTTTNEIRVNNNNITVNGNNAITVNYGNTFAGMYGGSVVVSDIATGSEVTLWKDGYINFTNPSNKTTTLAANNITNPGNTFEFPNKITGTYTLATIDDIPSGGVTSVGATSPITSSGGTTPVISTSMATNKLIGRSTAGTGVMEEITVGTGLTLTGGTLNASATGGGISHGTATASTPDTYTTTISGVTAYNDADAYLIRFTTGNTTSATLNINGLGAIPLYRNNDGVLIGGDIIDGGEMLCVYNSTTNRFQVIGTAPNSLFAYVTNDESVTITKGQVVYAFSGTGDRMTVKLAYNTGDATSAQTVGLVLSTSIAAGQKGIIMMQGLLDGLSILPTGTWDDGDPVYLGATAGSITNVKPYAPNHLVYLGVVTTASNGAAGRMYVRVQNGYEMNELHDVQSNGAVNKDILYRDTTVTPNLWKPASIPTILGYTPPNLGLVQAMTQGLQNIF